MNKLLIANRGEIARRVMRTCREMGISTVAIFSVPDRDAPFVAEADEAVALGGSTPAESYLRIDAVIDAARRSGADAIHPGYGFLAENAEFARRCGEAGLTFVGPTPEAIAAMGSKIEAKRRVAAAGVPLLGSIDVGQQSASELQQAADGLGWPVLVKASAGGGGRGMRIVRKGEDLAAAVAAAQGEAKSAFGDGTVFIEPYIESSRHVEIQIFGDTHGNVIHLFERECSIQRRHQKIIEESPSPALDDTLRAKMGDAAVQAGKAIGYTNAGTVEFLLADDGKFYFLEVNTRLQVEHPVTECVTGLDLVRLQIEVARGQALPQAALQAQLAGHAIEVRIYAEDPRRDFMPVTGRLHAFDIPELPGLRVESGVSSSSEVSPYYDSMLAKLIMHAPTREEAAARLASVLAKSRIHGLCTNRELLVRILRHPEFLAGETDTHFLTRHKPVDLGAPLADDAATGWHAAAASLAAQSERRATARVLPYVPSGWRNNVSQLQQTRFQVDGREIMVGYRFDRGRLKLEIDGVELADVEAGRCTPTQVELTVSGVRRIFEIHRVGTTAYVDSPLGSSELVEIDPFPLPEDAIEAGSLIAPLPGVVHEVKVAVGADVAAGDVLLVIESMKMLHPVTAPTAGRVTELRVERATQVDAGTVLAVIEENTVE